LGAGTTRSIAPATRPSRPPTSAKMSQTQVGQQGNEDGVRHRIETRRIILSMEELAPMCLLVLGNHRGTIAWQTRWSGWPSRRMGGEQGG